MSRVKSNPLSTRFVQPGRIDWLATSPERSLTHLANYFTCQLNWRAAIVGPHGSGKSTLLEHLVPLLGPVVLKRSAVDLPGGAVLTPSAEIAESQRPTVWLKLRGRSSSRHVLRETRSQWCRAKHCLVLDGFEQLTIFSRAMIVFVTSRSSVGLLVTSHRRTALPTLVATSADAALASQLLEQTLPVDLPNRARLLDQERLAELLRVHHGNLREVFMQLYDEIELAGKE